VIMPPIGLALGGVDFSNLFFNLSGVSYPTLAEARAAGAATIRYGLFLNTVFNFMIVAFAMFSVIKVMNRMKRVEPEKPAEITTRACPECLSEIPIRARRCSHCSSPVAEAR